MFHYFRASSSDMSIISQLQLTNQHLNSQYKDPLIEIHICICQHSYFFHHFISIVIFLFSLTAASECHLSCYFSFCFRHLYYERTLLYFGSSQVIPNFKKMMILTIFIVSQLIHIFSISIFLLFLVIFLSFKMDLSLVLLLVF